jgi:hypothetical protein
MTTPCHGRPVRVGMCSSFNCAAIRSKPKPSARSASPALKPRLRFHRPEPTSPLTPSFGHNIPSHIGKRLATYPATNDLLLQARSLVCQSRLKRCVMAPASFDKHRQLSNTCAYIGSAQNRVTAIRSAVAMGERAPAAHRQAADYGRKRAPVHD